jgi:hypothetical protein
VGVADVVNSTRASGAGRYKVVNTAGAAVIAGVVNALGGRSIPFAFGGDGASFAVGPGDAEAARAALAATAAWARDELDLTLRAALIPVEAVRAEGFDVRVARFAVSPHVTYAMFSGGGIAFAERALKADRFPVEPGPVGARPDLTGLSCRWEEIRSAHGVILSLLVVPPGAGDEARFRALVGDLLAAIETSPEVARPLTERSLALGWPGPGLDLEARVGRAAGQGLWPAKLGVLARTLFAYAIFRSGLKVGRFDPQVYRRDLVENSDFRKYDDGLRMTLDCTPAFADGLERRLEAAHREGAARFGLHRQASAVVTCITPSPTRRDHVHFVDGAAGGYALAALQLKERAGLSA